MPLGQWSGMAARKIGGGFATRLLQERSRWPLWLPVGMACGIGLYFSLNDEPSLWTGITVLATALAALYLSRRQRWLPVAMGMIVAMCLGFVAIQVRTATVGTEMMTRRVGPVTVTGTVIDITRREGRYRLVIDQPNLSGRRDTGVRPRRIRLSIRGDARPAEIGSVIRVRAVLLPVPPPVAPGAYDFQRRSFFRGVGATGFAIGPVHWVRAPPSRSPAWIEMERIRSAATRSIISALPGDTGAVAAALLTGKRDRISPKALAAIRDSGLAHLLAISGLHVGLVVGAVFFMLRLLLALWRPVAAQHPVKKWAAMGALLAGLLYVLLAGAPIPTQRAFLMVAVVMVAVMIDRIGISMRLVAAAATVLLLVSPEVLVEPGFQMSFAAVIALIAVYERFRRRGRTGPRRTWQRYALLWVGGIMLTSLVANAATAPFALFHFNRLAVYGLAANLVAVPVTAFWVMPLGLIALVLMPFGLEMWPLAAMGWGIDVILAVAAEVTSWPGAVSHLPPPTIVGMLFLAAGGLWLTLWQGRWRIAGVPVMLLGFLSPQLVTRPDILIAPDGRLMAVRLSDQRLLISSVRRKSFVASVWTRREGAVAPGRWPRRGVRDRLRCDREGCIYRQGAYVVALSKTRMAVAEDCPAVTLLISRLPVGDRCPAPLRIIDLYDMRDFGAHAIWLGEGITIATDRAIRGNRPWVALPPVRSRRVNLAFQKQRATRALWQRGW